MSSVRRLAPLAVLLVSGPLAADQALTVTLSPPTSTRAGERAEVGISVEARGGRTLHPHAPLFVDLDAPDPAGLARQRLERADALRFDAPAASFRVEIRPTEAGTHSLRTRVRAWVCRGSRCRAVETTRIVRIAVTAP